MTASYPNSGRAFRNPTSSTTAVQSDGTDLHAADHTAVEEEVAAISSDLRTAKGASANIATKIAAMDASIASAYIPGGTDVAIADGGTGSSTASGARTNLGLGGAAVLNVGTTAGTVAAGDDSRFANQNTRPYVLVASSEASATLKSSADYVCTGTNDEVVIQNAIKYAGDNAINHVKLSSGTFYIDALDVINLAGPDTAGTTFYRSMRLEGAGLPYASGASRYGTVLRWDVASAPASKQAILSIRPYTSDPGTGRTRHRYHINNIAIDGNGYGNVIGLKMQWVNIFYLADINIVGCRGFGLYMHGVSDGTAERVRFNSCGTASTTSSASSTAATMISDNIAPWTSDNIVFRDCTWENGMERMLSLVSQDPDSALRGAGYTFTLSSAQTFKAGDVYTATSGGPFRILNNGTSTTSLVATSNGGSPPASGTLTKLSGDAASPATIAYSSFVANNGYINQQAIYSIHFDRCKFEQTYTVGGSSNALIQAEGIQGLNMRNCYFYAGTPANDLANPNTATALNKPNAFIWLKSAYNVNIMNSFFSNTSTLQSSVETSTTYGIYVDQANAAAGLGAIAQGINISNNEFSGGITWGTNSIVWNTNNTNINSVFNAGNWRRDSLTTVESKIGTGSLVSRPAAQT